MSATAILQSRPTHAPVDDRFVARASGYAFDPQAIEPTVLHSLFEAARWAPSSFNEQPWRFHIATSGPERERLNQVVMEGNRTWSDAAPALIFVVAKNTFSEHSFAGKMGLAGNPNRHAAFDTGAATMQLILQAHEHGLISHAMGGIDVDAAHEALGLDDQHTVICALAVGYPGDPADLPPQLRERAQRGPSQRLAAADTVTWLQQA